MRDDILKLAKKFIVIPSTMGDPASVQKVIQTAKYELGDTRIDEFEDAGVPSLLVYNQSAKSKLFKIVLNGHLDVVSGKKSQYSPIVKNGRLYGRGAYDMKSATAVMILLFRELEKKINYPLGLQITADEETGGAHGTDYQIKNGVRAEFVITGEGSNFKIVNESKVRMIIKFTAYGKTSHGAYPWLGDNAILKMHRALYRMYQEYPLAKSEWSGTTINVTSIGTNNQFYNKTPDHCEAVLDARVMPAEKDSIIESLQSIVSKDIVINIAASSTPHQTSSESKYIKRLCSLVERELGVKSVIKRAHGESDARYFTAVGCESVEFGPSGGNHHADSEWVDIKSLEDYYNILREYLLSWNEAKKY